MIYSSSDKNTNKCDNANALLEKDTEIEKVGPIFNSDDNNISRKRDQSPRFESQAQLIRSHNVE